MKNTETINYWIGTEPKRENIRLSLVAAVELAERDDINCIYFYLIFFYTADCISISNFGNEYLRHLP